jgi:hypothetical protein
MLAHDVMAEMRSRHPDWIWNRSDTHTFVAPPGSHESFKTIVEPGNSFSPGPETYGVSTWVYVDDTLYAPERLPLDALPWRFLDGSIPILTSEWRAGPLRITSRLFSDGDVAMSDVRTYLSVEVANEGPAPVAASLHLVIRSFGAAGGPVRELALRDGSVHVNGSPLIVPDRPADAFGAMSYAASGEDISVPLQRGVLPPDQEIVDPSTWASGSLAYRLALDPGQLETADFAFQLHADHPMLTWLRTPVRPLGLATRRDEFARRWRDRSPITLDVPDQRFAEAFFAQLTHMAMLTVGDAPRVSPLTYPLWWVRDAAYIVAALDKGGEHDAAARACRDAVRRDAATGFGSEADVPGELIWMLTEHALLTGDLAYLGEVYPFVEAKADLLLRMATTDVPLKAPHEYCTHEQMLTPVTDLICLPAEDGLIVGRMDHHFPTFWVNGFAWLGLSRAARAASLLGRDGERFSVGAQAIRAALQRAAPERFGQNERDVVSAVWPTGWATPGDPLIRSRFEESWERVRCPDGVPHHEPLWTYFEAGEAHNWMLLGRRDRAWAAIEHFLSVHSAPGLYCYPEGARDENSASLLWERTRGWDRMRFVTPNLWTSAELFLLMRDALIREDGDALVIGSGVPSSWLGHPFAAREFPTHFGPVSLAYRPSGREVVVTLDREPPGGVRLDFDQPTSLVLERRPAAG